MEEDSFPRGKRTTASSSSAADRSAEADASAAGGGAEDRRKKKSKLTSFAELEQIERKEKRKREKRERKRAASAGGAGGNDEEDNLFGSRGGGGGGGEDGKALKKKRKGSADLTPSTSVLPLGGGAVVQPGERDHLKSLRGQSHSKGGGGGRAYIQPLKFAHLAPGTLLLGVIKEVRDEYALVSLPGMLTGYIRRSPAGDDLPLDEALTEGSVMAVVVKEVGTDTSVSDPQSSRKSNDQARDSARTSRRIELDAAPSAVNARLGIEDLYEGRVVRGAVSSVEDHGCVVDLGMAGSVSGGDGGVGMGFLRFDRVEGEYDVPDDTDEESEDDDSDGDDDQSDSDDSDDDGKESDKKKRGGRKSASSARPKSKGAFLLRPGRIYDFAVAATPAKGGVSTVQLSLSRPAALSKSETGLYAKSAPTPSSGGRSKFKGANRTPVRHTLRSLRPGMLTSVDVEHVAKNGLCVTFLGGAFRGAVEMGHLGGYCPPSVRDAGKIWWMDVFSGKAVKARITAVDPVAKIVRFTLLPHLLALSPPLTTKAERGAGTMPGVGRVLAFSATAGSAAAARVIRHDPGMGALIAIPPDDEDDDEDGNGADEFGAESFNPHLFKDKTYKAASRVRCAYLHISKAADGPSGHEPKDKDGKHQKSGGTGRGRAQESSFSRHYGLGSRVMKFRIIDQSRSIDGLAAAATAESILKAGVLGYEYVKPGAIYRKCKVVKQLGGSSGGTGDGGAIIVALGPGVQALIPPLHLFDRSSSREGDSYRSRIREEKYAPGREVDVRCIECRSKSKKCVVTAKSGLIKSDVDNPVASFAAMTPGRVATGYVTKSDSKGIFVSFYNNLYGHVTSRRLAREMGVEDPTQNYSPGDVVKCRILKREEKGGRRHAELSLNLQGKDHKADIGEGKATGAGASAGAIRPVAGSVLPPKSMKIVELVGSRTSQRDASVLLPGHAVVSIKAKHLGSKGANVAVDCRLPYDQLLDSYDRRSTESIEALDSLARKLLSVGKKINQAGLVLETGDDDGSAMPAVTIRPGLVSTSRARAREEEAAAKAKDDDDDDEEGGDPAAVAAAKSKRSKREERDRRNRVRLPSPASPPFLGARLRGYVSRVDSRYGAFVKFLDGVTGIVPKIRGGLDAKPFETVFCKVVALGETPANRDGGGKNSRQKMLVRLIEGEEALKIERREKALGADAEKAVSEAAAEGDGDSEAKKKKAKEDRVRVKPGDVVGNVRVTKVGLSGANVELLDDKYNAAGAGEMRARIHMTMARPLQSSKVAGALMPLKKPKKDAAAKDTPEMTPYHPLHGWKEGDVIKGARCVGSKRESGGPLLLELTNIPAGDHSGVGPIPKAGAEMTATITSVCPRNRGVWVQVRPGVPGFLPALELTENVDVLNDLGSYCKAGGRIECSVVGVPSSKEGKGGDDDEDDKNTNKGGLLKLSALARKDPKRNKPEQGTIVVGRIARNIKCVHSPALMLELRGGVRARCDITELTEVDDWVNMPLGNARAIEGEKKGDSSSKEGEKGGDKGSSSAVVTDEDSDSDVNDKDKMDVDEEDDSSTQSPTDDYSDGKYVPCRVLTSYTHSHHTVDVSLRPSRLEGDLEDDPLPNPRDAVQAYVIDTNKRGCFVRLSRNVEGRVMLKEMSDGFLPDPAAMFPQGRLVVGRVKKVHPAAQESGGKKGKKGGKKKDAKSSSEGAMRATVDLDMRETTLLDDADKLAFADVKVGSKYRGVVTRVESYGAFVRLDGSENVSGLAHISECCDGYAKDVAKLYDPGDLVKVFVIKKDDDKRRIGFSLKASHFEEDDDSDDESSSSGESESEGSDDEDMPDVVRSVGSGEDDDIDSEDEDYATKLAAKLGKSEGDDDEESSDDDDDSSASDSSDSDDDSSSDDEEDEKAPRAMDTDVGFDWGSAQAAPDKKDKAPEDSDDGESSSSDEASDSDDDDEVDNAGKSSHKSRKKAAAKRREEKEIAIRETALADGTADDNPETAADFERLLAGEPNSSVLWMRYMAYHLSLADVDGARNVANRAFERIEFRQEDEKLNVWTALLALEMKYGTGKSLDATIDRACRHNNPKQVYLRVCEMLEKEVDAASSDRGGGGGRAVEAASSRADDMFAKMCKKFKSKKTVWIARLKYLLKGSRHDEAHALLKRALTSLPSYKHVETMSKFAQLEFEHDEAERGRTIFDALLGKHPKRLDLLFVYVDKEVKNGEIRAARRIFENVVRPSTGKFKFSDKQMKSLFKKWYRIEEEHGDSKSQDHVKSAAKTYVERSTASK
uniref:S1 motif domain-containing protein n=1 Tax=Odontella aurita TaxID=265563 RepID=A0A7S4MZ58_9STRA|mmetsp:Transcript_41099/g.124142  ORF Transcript_41099/g.124142 Transcript_41099/m.124142 type:complete len:2265 (+) Transcript_41099:278-7072(+)